MCAPTEHVRYEWSFNDYTAFCQVTGQHQTHMITATGYVPAFDIPGFATYGASAGVAGAHRRSVAGLHELRARRVRLLLSMRGLPAQALMQRADCRIGALD
jgi:hypothetical protein